MRCFLYTDVVTDPSDSLHRHTSRKGSFPSSVCTFEKETEDGKLPFLDVCLCRESDGSVTTSVYRKPRQMRADGRLNAHPCCHSHHGRFGVLGKLLATGSGLPRDSVRRSAPGWLHGVGGNGATVERDFFKSVCSFWEHEGDDAADGRPTRPGRLLKEPKQADGKGLKGVTIAVGNRLQAHAKGDV